jgi:hypothetical protein
MACSKCQYTHDVQSTHPEQTRAEASSPGTTNTVDTGYVFRSQRTGGLIRVLARPGESRDNAIATVRSRHGMR